MDSLPYMMFQTFVFDIDSALAQQGVRVESCSYTRMAPPNPFDAVAQTRLHSRKLGACLFENAWQSMGSAGAQGVVTARVWFRGDVASAAPRTVYLTWRPVQVYQVPTRLSHMIFVMPEYWNHLQKNAKLVGDLYKHFADNEVVIWSKEKIPLSRWTGSRAAVTALIKRPEDPMLSQIRFRMWAAEGEASGTFKGSFKVSVYGGDGKTQSTVLDTRFSTFLKPFSKAPIDIQFDGEIQ